MKRHRLTLGFIWLAGANIIGMFPSREEAPADTRLYLDRSGDKMEFRPLPFRKLLFDKVFALCALALILPLLLAIICILWATSGRPIFFSHTRLGKDGKPFNCLKFRTMIPDSEARLEYVLANDPVAREEWNTHHKLSRDPRVSPFGRFLRQSSLDELPQFWNVLRGDMSVVGPRPISVSEVADYAGDFPTYAAVRPGITGVWQTSGRSNASFSERVKMDVEYIRNWNLRRDIKLTWRTLSVIVSTDGAY